MTRQPPLGPDDARQPDRLDAFLDGLADGRTVPPRDLDPTLAATVRHVHGLASESVANDLDRAGKAQRWEHLMQNQIAYTKLRSFPTTATLPSSSAPLPIPLRPAAQQSRLRRLGGQSLGLVATLTLVLLVAALSLAVYLTAPQGGDDPTMLPAAQNGTASAEATPAVSNPRLALEPCEAVPVPFDDVMAIVAAPYAAPDGSLLLISSLGLPLPDGSPVNPTTTDAVTTLMQEYFGCQSNVLQVAALSTDTEIRRSLSYRPNGAPTDYWEPAGGAIIRAWQDQDPERLATLEQRTLSAVLGEFRMLPDGKVAGYLSNSYSLAADGALTVGHDGYVVFAQVDGRWLVDDYRPAPQG